MVDVIARPRILIVEDDAPTLDAYAETLGEEFEVSVALDGPSALKVAERLRWDLDALVVDLGLGDGPRGDQFVMAYRRHAHRDTPVIVVSGAPRAYELSWLIRPAAVLAKPVDFDELVHTVRLFARPAREDEAAG